MDKLINFFKKSNVISVLLMFFLAIYALDAYSLVAIFLDVPLNDRHFANIIFAYIAVFFIFLFFAKLLSRKLFKIFLAICFVPVTVANAVIITYLIYYHAPMSVLDFQTILDTNLNETVEFMKYMFDYKILIIAPILILPYVIIYFLRPIALKWHSLNIFVLVIALVIIGFTYDKRWVKRQISYLSVYDAYVKTNEDKEDFLELLRIYDNSTLDNSSVITSLVNNSEKQVFVVVIGESQNRIHNSLYDYKRSTFANLSLMKDELYIFNDVVAPYVYTSAVLQKVLLLSDSDLSVSTYSTNNLIQFFKRAGFKTYWLSNQYYLGEHDSGYAAIAFRSDKVVFLNQVSGFFLETANYDESLLAPFNEAINEPGDKKIIFVHLMGSHAPFIQRYPKSFGSFTDLDGYSIDKQKVLTGYGKEESIDSYDNSIEYTDFLLNEMILSLKKQNAESFLLFFSDHGVDVFDTFPDKDLPRGNSYLTKSMVDIPFVLWISDKYRNGCWNDFVEKFDELKITDRPYQIQILSHSIIDLARLKSSDVNLEYSIFSDKFVPQKRLFDGKDYDTIEGQSLK